MELNKAALIASKIKELLKENKISATKMLSDCNLNKNTLSTMQSGGYLPRLETITQIADYLDCSVDYLLGREDNHKAENTYTEYAYDSGSDNLIVYRGDTVFWERFSELCNKKNLKPNPVAKEIGISSGVVSKWKNFGTLPSSDTLTKIADYFDCSVDYLLGRTASPSIDSAPAADTEETTLLMQLDIEDRAEVRGIMKQMLRADKYTTNADAVHARIAELQQHDNATARMVAQGGNSALDDTANPTPEDIERAKAILEKTTSK